MLVGCVIFALLGIDSDGVVFMGGLVLEMLDIFG